MASQNDEIKQDQRTVQSERTLFVVLILIFGFIYVLYKAITRDREKTYSDKKGYLRFWNSGLLVHRSIAEKILGRKLRNGEVVHHKNRNKKDNRPSNLYIFKNQKEHNRAHKIDAKRHGKKASYKGF